MDTVSGLCDLSGNRRPRERVEAKSRKPRAGAVIRSERGFAVIESLETKLRFHASKAPHSSIRADVMIEGSSSFIATIVRQSKLWYWFRRQLCLWRNRHDT